MQNIFTNCNPFDPSASLDGCLAAVPKMQCTDITGVVDSIKQAKKMTNNNTFCSSIHSAVTPVKLKGAATSGDAPQKLLAKQYTNWYKNTIALCVINMCKTSAFPVAQANLNSTPVRVVEELITSQLSSWEKFAFVNCKGVAASVVITFIILLTVIGYLITTHNIMGTIEGLLLPAKIYGVLLVIGCAGTMFAPCNTDGCITGKASSIVMSLLFGALWTWIINKLYKSQWTKTAWVLALLPIIGSILLLLLAFSLIASFGVTEYLKGKKPSKPKAN